MEIMEDTPGKSLFDGSDMPRILFFRIDLDLIQD